MLFLPVLYFGIPLLLIGGLEIFEGDTMRAIDELAESSRFMLYLQIGLIGLIIYGIWAFFKYRNTIGKEMKAAIEQFNELNNVKLQQYNNYVQLKGEEYQITEYNESDGAVITSAQYKYRDGSYFVPVT